MSKNEGAEGGPGGLLGLFAAATARPSHKELTAAALRKFEQAVGAEEADRLREKIIKEVDAWTDDGRFPTPGVAGHLKGFRRAIGKGEYRRLVRSPAFADLLTRWYEGRRQAFCAWALGLIRTAWADSPAGAAPADDNLVLAVIAADVCLCGDCYPESAHTAFP